MQEGISNAQKAVAELSQKLQALQHEVQHERTRARVIMDTLYLENFHIRRLAFLPVMPTLRNPSKGHAFHERSC